MNYRLVAVPVIGAILVLTGFLIFGNLNQNLVYYLTPAEAMAKKVTTQPDERFRLGGLIQDESVVRTETEVNFKLIADGVAVPVSYEGVPAQLFAPGVGAIVEGAWSGDVFDADTIIIKHDEEYRTPTEATDRSRGQVQP